MQIFSAMTITITMNDNAFISEKYIEIFYILFNKYNLELILYKSEETA